MQSPRRKGGRRCKNRAGRGSKAESLHGLTRLWSQAGSLTYEVFKFLQEKMAARPTPERVANLAISGAFSEGRFWGERQRTG